MTLDRIIPVPSEEALLARLEGCGAVRYEDLLRDDEEDTIHVRRRLDELEISREVTRLVVGEHIFYRRED